MNKNNFVDILALLKKMEIHSNPYLNETDKELYKHIIDEIKKQSFETR